MELSDIRYKVEHVMVPEWFYKEKEKFVAAFKDPANDVVFTAIRRLALKENIEFLTEKEEFQRAMIQINSDYYALMQYMPKPDKAGECIEMIMIFNTSFDKMYYFTVESAGKISNDRFLCGWTGDRKHVNYGEAPKDENELMFKIVDLIGVEVG